MTEKEIRNQVIDEFVKRLKIDLNTYYQHFVIDKIAEELRGTE